MVLSKPKVSVELEVLLRLTAREIQLPPSLDEKARQRYETLVEFLSKSALARVDPCVYAQGSYAIGTTIKPLADDDYDLDFVVEVNVSGQVDPANLMDAVRETLEQSATYENMIEPRPSCIRIHYADGFHSDIVPAIPDTLHGGTAILIPRRESTTSLTWHATNPKGYVRWFSDQAAYPIAEGVTAQVEPLPPAQGADQKSHLQVTVQLLKRNRDVRVQDEHLRTASIVITTIAAESDPSASLGETFDGAVDALATYAARPEPARIVNPAARYEVLSEKWERPEVYQAFQSQAASLRSDWNDVLELQGEDRPSLVEKLAEMFGEKPVHAAVKAASESIQRARKAGELSVGAAGTLAVGKATKPIPTHSFYGD